MPLPKSLKVPVYFTLWYLLNIAYNILNKKSMNAYTLPFTQATMQLGVGLVYVLPTWALGFRRAPTLTLTNFRALLPIAVFHTIGHVLTVLSLSAGSVSFTHIVKAAEPFFSSVVGAVTGAIPPLPVMATLIPVVGGVCIASLKELSFTWTSFLAALGSNLSFAIRGVFSKKAMENPVGENMGPANLFAVLTIMSYLIMLPVCLVLEGSQMIPAMAPAIESYGSANAFYTETFLAGLFYYLYNEVAFLALSVVDTPVTHAVGNTIKRVVVLVASTVYFKTEMTAQAVVGCCLAIGGVLLYSVVDSKYKKKRVAGAKKAN